jgi:pilus assembly protein CpaC
MFNGGDNGFLIGTGTGQFGNVSGDNPAFGFNQFTNAGDSFGTLGGNALIGNTGIAGTIDALERDGVLKVLAEPNLVALSGEEAQFLAGGEFPIPVPQQLGTTTIEYKPFGVALKFTPHVLSENRLRIQVQPEVSELSFEQTIDTGDGFVAPSLITRRASTTVELAPGESFMIAGLIRDNMSSQINELPGVGEIPVLSALFRSTSYQRNETELVIAVTPYLVDPIKGTDIKMPTDDFRPASFMESIFFGTLSGTRGNQPSVEGPSGFMTD